MARRRGARASAVLQGAHLPATVVTPRTENIRGRIANRRLGKAGDESIRRRGIGEHGLFEEVLCNALVVSRNVGVILQHGGSVHWEPRQDSNVLAIRGSLEPHHRHRLLHVVRILRPLLRRVGEIGVQTAVYVCVRDVCAGHGQMSGGQGLVGSLHRQHGAGDDGLEALLAEAKVGHLRKQVVEPSAGTRVLMCAGHGYILLSIYGIVGSQCADAFQDTVSDRCITAAGVYVEINKPIGFIFCASNDESTSKDSLPKAGSKLTGRCIPGKVKFDNISLDSQ